MIKKCTNCNEEKEHHAKGLCYACYKKTFWKPKISKCSRCKRDLPIHAKGFCASCYNLLFHSDKNKAYHHRKSNNIDLKTFRRITKECAICGFNKIVDIHHLDFNKKNNAKGNLIGLCPNHHRMINNQKFREEVFQLLESKGIKVPRTHKIAQNSHFKPF